VEVAGEPSGRPVDLSRYQGIGIRLASAVPRVLRVRLKGQDLATLNAGCYPVVMQRVEPQATQYQIPLAAFGPEPYCGAKGASAEQTLPAVVAVEVTVNEPSAEPVLFSVGRIEFLHTVAVRTAAPQKETPPKGTPKEPPRKRVAATDGAPAQPVRQVTCERNPRYGLVMCY
jgi:hypothetical protein